ncbi:MAG: OmpA family protein, partial [Pseudomonadota bacterium]
MSALWASLFHTTVVASEVDVERESSATFSQYNGNGLSFPQMARVDPALLAGVVKFYFEVGKSNLKPEYSSELDAVIAKLKANDQIGVQISGYASAEGDEDKNRELSNKRAISVLDYINQRG